VVVIEDADVFAFMGCPAVIFLLKDGNGLIKGRSLQMHRNLQPTAQSLGDVVEGCFHVREKAGAGRVINQLSVLAKHIQSP
jgi:hypothetical protein